MGGGNRRSGSHGGLRGKIRKVPPPPLTVEEQIRILKETFGPRKPKRITIIDY